MSDLDQPLPGGLTVLAARDHYLAENGFTTATYDSKGSTVTVFGIDFYRPLTDDARKAIRRHDLHHVATGYGTDLVGEGEVSAWEVSSGLKGLGLYVRVIVCGALLVSFLRAPRRVLRAYRTANNRGTLFSHDDYEALLAMRVEELRALLGIPPEGLAREPRRLHAHAPSNSPLREGQGER